jgi:hypothetical protein
LGQGVGGPQPGEPGAGNAHVDLDVRIEGRPVNLQSGWTWHSKLWMPDLAVES